MGVEGATWGRGLGLQKGDGGTDTQEEDRNLDSLLDNVLFPHPPILSPRRENGASWEAVATVGKWQGLPAGPFQGLLAHCGARNPGPVATGLLRAVLGEGPKLDLWAWGGRVREYCLESKSSSEREHGRNLLRTRAICPTTGRLALSLWSRSVCRYHSWRVRLEPVTASGSPCRGRLWARGFRSICGRHRAGHPNGPVTSPLAD